MVDNITAMLRSRNTEGVTTGPSPRDIRAAKRRADVSAILFYMFFSAILHILSHLVHIQPQPFLVRHSAMCQLFFTCFSQPF